MEFQLEDNCWRTISSSWRTIDGVGTRGVPLEILEYVGNWSLSCSPPLIKQYRICELFDYIGGTSTVALIALYLAMGHSVAECRQMYFNMKDKIFSGSRPYSTAILEAELKATFGENTKMSEIPGKIRCIVTSTTGSPEHLTRVLFTNYHTETKDKLMWTVARCTTAAPFYFDPFEDPSTNTLYYDGGLTANNPCLAVLTEIHEQDPAALKNGLVVSIGTGQTPESKPLDLTHRSIFGSVKLATDLFQALLNQVCKSDGEAEQVAITICSLAGCRYYRLSPFLQEAISLDETDNKVLVDLINSTKDYTKIFKAELDQICDVLYSGRN